MDELRTNDRKMRDLALPWDGLYPLPPDDGPRVSEKRPLLRVPTWLELIAIRLGMLQRVPK
jgi:hypothetical protein